MLTLMLGAALPSWGCRRSPLQQLWIEEALQRAGNFIELAHRLDQRGQAEHRNRAAQCMETANAAALAGWYRALDRESEGRLEPCSRVLRAITCGVVELFGPAAGDIAVETRIRSVTLPAFKRRALVLACSKLLFNALRHGFRDRSQGVISVGLSLADDGRGSLTVADDGLGFCRIGATPDGEIAADLARLLEGELRYPERPPFSTTAEIQFPIGL
jgi:two-component sensor histidine kinase